MNSYALSVKVLPPKLTPPHFWDGQCTGSLGLREAPGKTPEGPAGREAWAWDKILMGCAYRKLLRACIGDWSKGQEMSNGTEVVPNRCLRHVPGGKLVVASRASFRIFGSLEIC
jgi:hypothetical protein